MAAETSVIYQIGIHATASTALPTAPTKGSHIDLATANYVVIGGRGRSDDLDVDEDSITLPFVREDSKIQPYLSGAPTDHINRSAYADEFEFVCYDVSETLFNLDSDASVSSHVGDFGQTDYTKRTVAIEVNGLLAIYFPQCVVHVSQMVGGYGGDDGAVTATVKVKPEGTSSLPGGYSITWFQSA